MSKFDKLVVKMLNEKCWSEPEEKMEFILPHVTTFCSLSKTSFFTGSSSFSFFCPFKKNCIV